MALKNAVGLDIGSSSIKLVQIKEVRKRYALENFAVLDLPPNTIVEGAIHQPKDLTEMISELKKRMKVKEVALSIGGHSLITKKISLPARTEAELAESIKWEAEQYIPFNLSDVYLDFNTIQLRAELGQMDVLLVAAKKDVVNQYVDIVKSAGLKPVIVDADCFAVQNCLEYNYGLDPNLHTAIIHIGAENLNINVIAYGLTTFTRDLQLGGNLYTQALQKQLTISYEEAEAYKQGGANHEHAVMLQDVQRILDQTSDQIASEIVRSIDFYLATSGESRLDRIFLSGGVAKMSSLRDQIFRKTGVEIVMLNPFEKIIVDPKVFNTDYIMDKATIATVAMGLSFRGRGDRERGLN
jgi:type IV pilus assembly protein PilM